MQHLPSPVFLFTSSLMFLFILMGTFDKCLHRSLTNISGNHERWALLQGQIWGEATSLKFWYICHFLNNYDLNKGRFIVSRSPGRLPRGFCISNQRLFVFLLDQRPNLLPHHPLTGLQTFELLNHRIFKETHFNANATNFPKQKKHTEEKSPN